MYNVFYFRLGSTSIGHARHVKNGTITVSGFGYFHKNCRFLWGKNVSKTNLGRTIHFTYTSYIRYFRLCMVQRSCGSMKSVSSFSSIENTLSEIPCCRLICFLSTFYTIIYFKHMARFI